MGDISKHFNRSEFECKCKKCGRDTVDVELINVLEGLRSVFNSKIIINSGNRCFFYNIEVGGSVTSQHISGKAVDIIVKGINPKTVYNYLDNEYQSKYGIGDYNTFTHIDVRPKKARW